jgi:hypothetical protein
MRQRGEKGTFQQVSDEKRQVRSVRLTDSTWESLKVKAESLNLTVGDLLESIDWQKEFPSLSTKTEDKFTLERFHTIALELESDQALTRKGKDRGTVRRTAQRFVEMASKLLAK